MNKYFSTIILALTSFSLIQGQDGYVKFTSDFDFREKKIKCLKGEILPFERSTKENLINIIFGSDTITDLKIPSVNVDTIQNPNTTYLSLADNFIQKKAGDWIYVNATGILSTDTVILISEKGTQLTQLIDKREAQVRKLDCGKKFRLIITNAPSIFYDSANLKDYIAPSSQSGEENLTPSGETPKWAFFASLTWWHYILFIIGLAGVCFAVWKFILRKDLEPVDIVYDGHTKLSDFATENNITLDQLIKLNKKKIGKKYKLYEDKERKQIQKSLKGEKLLVGYQPKNRSKNKSSDSSLDSPQSSQVIPVEENIFNPEETELPNSFNSQSDSNIYKHLQRIERNVINEIRNAGSKNYDISNEVNRLKNEISNLKNENNIAKSEKQNLDSTIAELRNEKGNLERDLESSKMENNRGLAELNNLKKKVVAVEYLKSYCESVSAYFHLCGEVSNQAYDYFERVSRQNAQQINSVGHLLMKFQNSINTLPVGNWVQIVQDIKDTGATTNKMLIRSFSQIQTDNERQREFQRLLFTEVLAKYSSSILILAEAFKNLGRFEISSDLVNDVQITFAKQVSELLSKVKTIGLETKYVSLFKNYMDYLGQSKAVDEKLSIAYKAVQGLERDSVAEVVSYGFRNTFGETDTLIILA